MSAAQLTLDMAAPTGELPPERRIAQAAHDETATTAAIIAVVVAIPMVGHRKGTARETIQRPVAYLYACRDRLDERDREIAISICSRVTRAHVQRIRSASVADVERAPVWLRMNGEPARGTPASTNARDAWRSIGGTPERDGYAWALNIAQRCPPDFRAAFKSAQAELRELAPEMLGTLAGWLLVLRWCPALADVVEWRRQGLDIGPQMLVAHDARSRVWEPNSDASVRAADHDREVLRLASLNPATSMLARAVMAVPPRGES